jgi:acetyltransferase-like isoleucine patch superfamily enzyme
MDVMARMTSGGGSPEPDSIRPVTIGDFCWVGFDTVVYPGVTMGDGSMATIGTHVSRDVPPFCLVSGNPMKIRLKLPVPPELIDIVGEERYREYLEIQKQVKIHR